MVAVLVLLLVAQLPSWYVGGNSIPVCCFYSDIRIDTEFTNIITLTTTPRLEQSGNAFASNIFETR